jgi:hypothetical protein
VELLHAGSDAIEEQMTRGPAGSDLIGEDGPKRVQPSRIHAMERVCGSEERPIDEAGDILLLIPMDPAPHGRDVDAELGRLRSVADHLGQRGIVLRSRLARQPLLARVA